MFPLTYEFSVFEAQNLLSYVEILDKMGFGIRQMGKHSFMVDAIPPFLEEEDIRKILEELLLKNLSSTEEDSEQENLERKRRRHLAFLTSRFARGHKKTFMIQEALTLVEELLKTEAPYQCPQGHKTIVYLGKQDVASFFTAKKR
jgi:DNA mismatch repair protein MutL